MEARPNRTRAGSGARHEGISRRPPRLQPRHRAKYAVPSVEYSAAVV